MIRVDLPASRRFTSDEARAVATELGIDFGALGRDLGRWGLLSEREHGPWAARTDVSRGDRSGTGNTALAHWTEVPDHWTHHAISSA